MVGKAEALLVRSDLIGWRARGAARHDRIQMLSARRLALPCLIAVAALFGGCDKKPASPPSQPTPHVGVITLQPHTVTLTTDLPGRTSAYLIADVRPQVSGLVTRRAFVEGADVKAGQQLYQIDPAPYRAALDSALATMAHDKAALSTARAKSARYKPLAAAQAVSKQDYDDAVAATGEAAADILSASAAIEQAQINLGYTKVAAPISGRIGRSSVTPGALVTANQTAALATITQLDPIYVDVEQPATTLLRLRAELAAGRLQVTGPNQAKVTLKLEDGSAYPHPGTLQFTEVNVDQSTGTVLLRAIFPNPGHLLLPGMYVQEEVQEGTDDQALLVPQGAVSHNPHGDPTVLLVGPGNKVRSQVIETGRALGADWVVTSGLKRGDIVIVDGLQKAKPGTEVVPEDSSRASSTPDGGNAANGKTPDGTAPNGTAPNGTGAGAPGPQH
jgi:membrane fusion protein (multidrug efflux system)